MLWTDLRPYYFHSISCLVADVLRNCFGIPVVQYLDDYMFVYPIREGASENQKLAIRLLRYLGFHISWSKVTAPATVATYLGVEIDTVNMILRLPQDKVEKFKSMVGKFSNAKFISRRIWSV